MFEIIMPLGHRVFSRRCIPCMYHLGCLHVLANVNHAAATIGVHISF